MKEKFKSDLITTPSEMDGICCNRLENNEDKAVDGENKRYRAMETGCGGNQGSPKAVTSRGWRMECFN
jgi:hypothetical protein